MENTASSIIVFTAPLHSNKNYSFVSCIFVVAGICLPCCLPMGLHVTIHSKISVYYILVY
jgi:hypothetical protein